MTRKAALATSLAMAVTLLCSCSGSSASSYRYFTVTRMTSSAGQRELLLTPKGPVRGLVLFAHGYGETELALLGVPVLQPLRDALLSSGFAMAASYSHGDNMGDPVSVEDQVHLLHDAERALPAVPVVEMIGFSMGGLDALMAASRHVLPGLDAVVLLSPVCDQEPFLDTPLGPAVRAAFADRTGQALVDAMTPSNPVRQDPHSFAGYRYWFWQSPHDTTVPPAQTAGMLGILRSAGIEPRFSPLTGDHGDLAALRPGLIVQWFESRA